MNINVQLPFFTLFCLPQISLMSLKATNCTETIQIVCLFITECLLTLMRIGSKLRVVYISRDCLSELHEPFNLWLLIEWGSETVSFELMLKVVSLHILLLVLHWRMWNVQMLFEHHHFTVEHHSSVKYNYCKNFLWFILVCFGFLLFICLFQMCS